MAQRPATPNLTDFLTVSQAARFLGVSTWTLRNWDRDGKLVAVRNPINGYRLYRREDLEALLAAVTRRPESWKGAGRPPRDA